LEAYPSFVDFFLWRSEIGLVVRQVLQCFMIIEI
jgi:hypothetical protein